MYRMNAGEKRDTQMSTSHSPLISGRSSSELGLLNNVIEMQKSDFVLVCELLKARAPFCVHCIYVCTLVRAKYI